MHDVVFRKQAEGDLLEIRAWFNAVAPEATRGILADIDHSIERLRNNPKSAPKVDGRNWRRIVTRRYRFKIAYLVRKGRSEILGIYRYQNRER